MITMTKDGQQYLLVPVTEDKLKVLYKELEFHGKKSDGAFELQLTKTMIDIIGAHVDIAVRAIALHRIFLLIEEHCSIARQSDNFMHRCYDLRKAMLEFFESVNKIQFEVATKYNIENILHDYYASIITNYKETLRRRNEEKGKNQNN